MCTLKVHMYTSEVHIHMYTLEVHLCVLFKSGHVHFEGAHAHFLSSKSSSTSSPHPRSAALHCTANWNNTIYHAERRGWSNRVRGCVRCTATFSTSHFPNPHLTLAPRR